MASKAIVSHNGPPAKPAEAAPSPSLYLKNLPEKIPKRDLRMSLYMLFSTYGPVLDVVDVRNGKMRGQAHVVFRDIQASTQAMRALQDFEFYGKELKIQYAKGRSGIFTKLEGVYKPSNAAESSNTEQQSIFTAPAAGAAPAPAPAPTSAPSSAPITTPVPVNGAKEEEGAQGVKRRRDDESDEEEASQEDDEDDDDKMEVSESSEEE